MGTTTVGTIGLNMVLNSSSFRKQLNNVQNQANSAGTKMSSAFKKIGTAIAAAFSVKAVTSFAKACTAAADIQTEMETKIATVMRQRMKASDETIQKIKDYASAQQELGVVGDEVQLSGAQQLSTFLKTDDALKTLIPAMNNLAVQQNGVNVGTSDMVNIGNLMGKVMQGQTSALTRVGVTFTEAQEKVLKYGNEQERAAMLAQVITDNVGEMNKAIANTPAGQIQKLKNSFGDMQETLGRSLQNVFAPLLKYLNSAVSKLSELALKFEEFTQKLFGNANSTSVATAGAVSDAVNSVSSLTDEADSSSSALDNITESAEKAKRSVAGFDKLNIITQDTSTTTNASDSDNSTAVSNGKNSPIATAMDNLTSSWNTKSKKLLDSVKGTIGKIKTAISEVGKSWSRVWNNGTGQKFLGNIKNLISDIIDNLGSVADAFTKAWNKAGLGDRVIQSFIDKANSLIELINIIAVDFGEVWNNGTGERIWGNILSIIRNCNNATKTLRDKIKEAWEKNDTGKKLWGDILGIVEDITGFLNDMSEIHLEWLEDLDLSPLMTGVEKLAGAFRELLKACGDKLKTVYKNILLPLAKWTIEKGVPKLVEMLAKALKAISNAVKNISDKTLYAIAGGIAAVATAVVAFKAGQAIANGISKVKNAIKLFTTTISANPLLAIASAISGIVIAAKSYAEIEWSNSSLKKEVDKTAELADEWGDLADEMSTKIDEINDTELTMKVDFENVDKMKDRLKEIIDDGTIDENEEGDYKTIVDLLGEKVDGFTDDWNTLTLEEIDGKIVIKDNIDDVNQKLDDLVANWEIAQAKMTFREVYSSLQTDVAKQKIKMEVEDKSSDIDKSKQELIDYIFEKSSLSKKESELLTNELIKQKGDIEKTNKSLIEQFDSGGISSSEYKNLYFALNDNHKHSFESVFGWNNWDNGTSNHIKEVVESISEMNEEQSRAKDTYDGLVDAMNEYESAYVATSGKAKNYNDYIKLSTEHNLSHDAVLLLLKDDGITTWEELEKAAKKSNDEVKGTLDETDNKFQESSRRAKAASNNTTVTIEKHTLKAKSSVENNLANGVPNAISTMWQRIKGVFTDGDGFVKIKDAIWGVFKNAINALISGINSLIRKPFDMLNGAFDNVRNFEFFGQKVFDWLPKIEAPQIPKLAKGGIVKAPTLAVVGDNAGANTGNPEVIAPLNKLQQMINTSNGQDVAILGQILDYLKRIYEMFVVFRNNGGNMYEFVAKLNGSTLFAEIVNQNELYKKRHNGKSAFA